MTEQSDQPPEQPAALTEEDKDAVRAFFEQVKASMPGFRPRRPQNQMIAEVARTVGPQTGGVAVIEAGTGCGKSLGYLIPSIPLAARAGKRLVISTGTIALQEQLLRELPALLDACGREEKVALVKGRQRYVCVRDLLGAAGGGEDLGFEDALFSSPPSGADARTIASLADSWGNRKWDGDMDKAPERITDPVRMAITTTPGGCTGRRCPHYEQCPLRVARSEARDADILLANHSLLLADLEPRPGVEPILGDLGEAIVCIDEAHQFAEDAINASAAHVPLTAAAKRLRRATKLVSIIFQTADKQDIDGQGPEQVIEKLTALREGFDALEREIKLVWTPQPGDREPEWRAPNGAIPDQWRQHASVLSGIATALVGWAEQAKKEIRSAKGRQADATRQQTGILAEQVDGYRKLLVEWAAHDLATQHPIARWVSLGHGQSVVCHASPTDASDFLKHMFWGRIHATVFTSATLSAGGDFRTFLREAAIPASAVPISLPSAFDLERQASVEVPYFHNEPNAPGHPREVADWLERELDWSQGSLVIFSSRRKMREVAELLDPARRQGVKVQGDLGKAELTQAHMRDIDAGKGSVIFGLQSMGEGIDLKGKYCSTVVITQLPFGRLTDPVKATFGEWLEAQGRNAFMEMTLPQAMLKLTQYAGRLIRTEDDTGRIVITDSRLRTKRYGRMFLDGLPPFRRVVERSPTARMAVNS